MSQPTAPDVTDRFTQNYIRRTARELAARKVVPTSDVEDLAQDLVLALLEQLPKYSPERGKWTTFVKVVIKAQAQSLCRKAAAERRGGGVEISSLNAMTHDEENRPTDLGDMLAEEEVATWIGRAYCSSVEQVDMALDVRAIVASLPVPLQELCRLLSTKPLTEAARDLNLPRSTVAYRVGLIRRHFADHGYDFDG